VSNRCVANWYYVLGLHTIRFAINDYYITVMVKGFALMIRLSIVLPIDHR
jgi:hypothetical protein